MAGSTFWKHPRLQVTIVTYGAVISARASDGCGIPVLDVGCCTAKELENLAALVVLLLAM